ncbi:MAG: hypothetical protein OXH85_04145 [Truepera sp.]|nr:hypothetical protein [Truepera sp.]
MTLSRATGSGHSTKMLRSPKAPKVAPTGLVEEEVVTLDNQGAPLAYLKGARNRVVERPVVPWPLKHFPPPETAKVGQEGGEIEGFQTPLDPP